MINSALELLELGLSVVPLQKNEKFTPEGCTWKEQQDLLPSEKLIEQRFEKYPNSDLGIITGRASGIAVVDGDSAEACAWIEKNFPHTWLTVSNSGRGKHYYFKYPITGDVSTSANVLYKGVDIRGNKGLIVAPPSEHKTGNIYEWNISEGFSLEDLGALPEYPLKYIDAQKKEHQEKIETEYIPGELKNIAEQCAWLRHCRADAEGLGYDEWVWMLSIVSRCVDGREKAHRLSGLSSKYNYDQCDKKINEVLKNMGAVSCRSISRKFEGCFACKNIGKGVNFSPVILGSEVAIEEPLTIIDIKKDNNSLLLDIPNLVLNAPGLIKEGLELLYERGLPDIPQLNLPSVLTVLANIISTKICYNKMYCNLFTLKIGKTSMGKSRIDDELTSEIEKAAMIDTELAARSKFTTDFASGTALYRELERYSHLLVCIDEGTEIFKRHKVRNPAQEEKKNVLLTLYTKAGKLIIKSYANEDNRIELKDHCLSILMNATPVVFDEMDMADFETGFYQRVDMWCYEGKIPYWDNNAANSGNAIKQFIDHLRGLAAINSDGGDGDVRDAVLNPREVSASAGFLKLLSAWSKETIDLVNSYNEDAQGGLIARRFDLAIKYAIIHSGATRLGLEIYEPLETENLEWGIAVAKMLTDWKIEKLFSRMTTGDFDRDLEYFKRAIFKVMAAGRQNPTFRYMMNRNKKMKNWSQKYSEEIIRMLQIRKEIITVDEQGKSTKYFLAEM